MLLKELFRLSSQNRTLYCYLILSVWIFLLIAGMYKYIGTTNTQTFLIKQSSNSNNNKKFNNYLSDKNDKIRKFQQDCNNIDDIIKKDEGGIFEGWSLQGILLIIRHGDRGPMAHVKGINHINCNVAEHENSNLLNKYKIYLSNTSTTAAVVPPAASGSSASVATSSNGAASSTTHPIWMKTGSFHGFPLLPTYIKSCLLGQLTYKGISQLLYIGDLLRQIYGNQLGLFIKSSSSSSSSSTSSSTSSLNLSTSSSYSTISDDIIIYSTRYRRTFQSAMALLFTFLPIERWSTITVRESHSLSYCFSDCACPQADYLKSQLDKINAKLLKQYSTTTATSMASLTSIGNLIQWIGVNLLQNPGQKIQPLDVRDAILSIICHNSPLPCRKIQYLKSSSINSNNNYRGHTSSTTESMDFINIDENGNGGGSDNNNNNNMDDDTFQEVNNKNDDNNFEFNDCIEWNHIITLMSYTNWQGQREAQHKFTKQQGLLRSYGLLHNIVNYILRMISGDKIKFVLYSGHDRTIQYLASALGLLSKKAFTFFIPYASRLIFEVYKSDKDHNQYYFRLLYNGNDVTKLIDFCEGSKSLRISKDNRGNKADLCPIENIIRFIHDDYFITLNATNYKDACVH